MFRVLVLKIYPTFITMLLNPVDARNMATIYTFVFTLQLNIKNKWPPICLPPQVDGSGEIIVLPVAGCPWKDHLMRLETELKIKPLIKFVLYTDTSNKWRVQCVPKEKHTFENR